MSALRPRPPRELALRRHYLPRRPPPLPPPPCHTHLPHLRPPTILDHPPAIDSQTEKSYQKQPRVSFAYKRINAKNLSAKDLRYTRAVGLGFKTPATAIKVSSMRGG